MPDSPEPTPQEEQVRRLLAEARHTAPTPDDVVARLDGVLADLGRERAGAGRPAELPTPPGDLAGARRRRTVRNLLVAAAAVVAVGVGLNEADLTVSGGGEDSAPAVTSGGAGADSAAGTGERGAAGGEADQPEAAEPSTVGGREFLLDRAPVRLTSERFGPQVRRLQAQEPTPAVDGLMATQSDAEPERNGWGAFRASCSTDGWGTGRLVAVRYDGDLGALVFRRAHGETQVVDLYLCGSDEPIRSITLPAR